MNSNKNKQIKIFVGMSGGVDSSVAAALLKQQGYNVTGVFIKIWDEKWGNCAWPEERRDAMKTAIKLGIPFKTLDLSAEYQKEVVDYMVREYKNGRTPNPDVMCNKTIKFGAFLKWALKNGADHIATGHYVRITHNTQRITQKITNFKSQNTKYQIPNTKYSLLTGIDESKDQSYFLWQLKQTQLKHCLFPIGDCKKSEVRELARKFNLPTAEKPDSQGICFVGKVGLKEFLKKYLQPKRGKVFDTEGETIGWHDGVFFLTLGQRHGFTITKKGTHDKPYYIIEKDIRKNTITVSSKHKNILTSKHLNTGIIISKVNWISGEPDLKKKYQARFRHLQKLLNCCIVKLPKGEYEVKFSDLRENAAPGQSLVLYDGAQCLGGGIIKTTSGEGQVTRKK
jgi:tRNA-specific 2-thiouridylase